MTPEDILCRTCGKDYSIPEGCAICVEAKANIVWPGMQESVNADLVAVSRRVVRMLDKQQKRLAREMDDSMGYHTEHTKECSLLARSIASILTEARKLEEREEKRVQQGGFDDQLGIFLTWLAGLPREYRTKALGGMERLLLPAGSEDAEVVE